MQGWKIYEKYCTAGTQTAGKHLFDDKIVQEFRDLIWF